jgi:hypothetical protein
MNIERTFDVIYKKNDLEPLYSFKNFPVFMGTTTEDPASDHLADMNFWISRGTGMIQLNPLLPLKVLYPAAHGAGCIGLSWESHHSELAKFISKFRPKSVLEIGGAHGILANNYQKIEDINWTILEPNPMPVDGCKAKFLKGFFDEKFNYSNTVDAIVHSHVFEHIYDPSLFMENLSNFLEDGKFLIFSVPNMRVMVERKYTNCLNFEHTVYLAENYIDILLTKNGFEILEKQDFQDDHSIFYAARKNGSVKKIPLEEGLYEKNKNLYLKYIKFHTDFINRANNIIKKREDRKVFLFGAHVQAQYLIGFGLNLNYIEAVLDNDKSKHGKRLYGTEKLVFAPSTLAGIDRPILIIRAGTFTSEIISQIKKINSTVEFVT